MNRNRPIIGQPDDPRPRAICPECGQLWPDRDWDVDKFIRKNAGNVTAYRIARFIDWPMKRLQNYARNAKPPIDLSVKKEAEPRGA